MIYNSIMAWNDEIRSKINRKAKSKAKRVIKKEIKKIGAGTWIIVALVFAVGLVAGGFTYSQIIKNDTFELIGQKNITLNIGDAYTYTEQGVKIISHGKDISDKVKIKTNIPEGGVLDTTVAGEYYVIYTVEDLRYGNIQKVRVITIGEGA